LYMNIAGRNVRAQQVSVYKGAQRVQLDEVVAGNIVGIVGLRDVVVGETVSKNKTLYELYFNSRNIFLDIFMILVSVVFLGVLANIRIPLWPVPITMQTFGVFAIAFFFGSRKGLLSILAYVLAGIVGFGVFAGRSSGMDVMMGPTGGYILGFLVAVFFVGYMIEKGYGRDKKSVLLCMVIGNLVIYLFGIIGLRLYFADFTWWKILIVGVIPFLIGDAIKILGAVALFPYLWKGAEKFKNSGTS